MYLPVLVQMRDALGGRVRLITSGSAPIHPSILDFLKIAFSCDVIEGYGQTENCGAALRCLNGDHSSLGSVGPPVAGAQIKLVDVPEVNHTST